MELTIEQVHAALDSGNPDPDTLRDWISAWEGEQGEDSDASDEGDESDEDSEAEGD